MPNWRGRYGDKPVAPVPVEKSAPGPDIDQEEDKDPFPCDRCEKGFTSQRGLSRHTTAVHVDRGGSPLD